MRKTHIKLGLLIAMTCLFLAAGMFSGNGTASAQNVQATRKFHHWFAQAPHITVKMLPSTAHHSSRVAIYGVGFNDCGSCSPATNSYSPCDTSCSTTSTTNTNTTTTTTTTTTTSTVPASTVPASTCPSYNTCDNSAPTSSTVPASTCPSYNTCGNSVPAPSTVPASTCPSYNTCGNSVPAPSTCPSYNTCDNSAPAPSTCPSYNTCGNSAPAPSYNDCSCNTVNLQSSAPISASGMNLSQVPVNAFGEFQVTVNVQPTTRHYTVPTIWAVNSYNDQPSNSAPMCSCSW